MPVCVRKEEVIGVDRVLVYGSLYQSHSEHARVEVQVLLRVARYRRDMMNSKYRIAH